LTGRALNALVKETNDENSKMRILAVSNAYSQMEKPYSHLNRRGAQQTAQL
jgi:hypothetical protein